MEAMAGIATLIVLAVWYGKKNSVEVPPPLLHPRRKGLVFDARQFRKLQSGQAAPLKFVKQLFPPRLWRLHPPQHILFQNHFTGWDRIHRSRCATTLMTSSLI
jgi:hypothetical protein